MRQLDLSSLNSEAAAALERMFTLYGDGMYKWMARLWEPEIGGFYYSNSARDYEGFLPDVESTAQAIHALKNNGLFEKYILSFLSSSRERVSGCINRGYDTASDSRFVDSAADQSLL